MISASSSFAVAHRIRDARVLRTVRPRRCGGFSLSAGTLDYACNAMPFPGGALTVNVAEGDVIASWRQSGLTFVGSK
mgnify:CR=1 FL=1